MVHARMVHARMVHALALRALKPAFKNGNDIPGLYQGLPTRPPFNRPGRRRADDRGVIRKGPVGETTCDARRGEHGHAGLIRVLPRLGDFAEDEERAIGDDLNGDAGIFQQVFFLQIAGDGIAQFAGGEAGGMNGAEQRYGDVAAIVDAEFTRELITAKGNHTHLIAGAQVVRRSRLVRGKGFEISTRGAACE